MDYDELGVIFKGEAAAAGIRFTAPPRIESDGEMVEGALWDGDRKLRVVRVRLLDVPDEIAARQLAQSFIAAVRS